MKQYFLFLWVVLLSPLYIWGQTYPSKPNPPSKVADYARFLTQEESTTLHNLLESIDAHTHTQISIVTIDDIQGIDISEYATGLGRSWGIGYKDGQTGLLILIVKSTHQIWIATGYGLEGIIPDIVARKIIQQEITPLFKQQRYFDGLQGAVIAILTKMAKAYEGKDPDVQKFYDDVLQGRIAQSTKSKQKNLSTWQVIFLFVAIIIFLIVASKTRSRRGGGGLMSGGFFIGGGGFGGGGGGGGSDFGGGSFGGGGAGGSW